MLASVAEQVGLSLAWSETPEDTFSHDEAHINKVKYDRIDFPAKIKDILKIENQNGDIRFNVYGAKGQSICPLYTSNKICDKTCNLLLIEKGNKNKYVWIKTPIN